MAEVVLEAPGVVAVVRQLVAAGVAQHVRMHREGDAGRLADGRQHLADGGGGEGGAALGQEDVRRERGLAAELAQGPQLVAAHRVGAGDAVLAAADVERGGLQVELFPLEGAQLRHAQAVAVAHQDQGGVAVAVAVPVAGDLHQLGHLGRREELAGAALMVGQPPGRRDFPIFEGRRVGHGAWNRQCLRGPRRATLPFTAINGRVGAGRRRPGPLLYGSTRGQSGQRLRFCRCVRSLK